MKSVACAKSLFRGNYRTSRISGASGSGIASSRNWISTLNELRCTAQPPLDFSVESPEPFVSNTAGE